MAVERAPGGSSLIDVLDRILDKGIVVDAWVRISLVGIDLITVEARVVMDSIDTYLKYAAAAAVRRSRPRLNRTRYASSPWVARVGGLRFFTNRSGALFSYSSGLSHGFPWTSHSGNHNPSVTPYIDSRL